MFIKLHGLPDRSHKDVIINLDNVTTILSDDNGNCRVYFVDKGDFVTVNESMDDLYDIVNKAGICL